MPSISKSNRSPWLPKPKPFDRRQVDNSSFYNSQKWRATSKAKRMQSPICEECERKGHVSEATEVDHIIRIEDGGDRWAWSNLQSLCKSCHAKKSAAEGRGAKFQ